MKNEISKTEGPVGACPLRHGKARLNLIGGKVVATARILILLWLALALPPQLFAAGPAPLDLFSNTNFVVLAETTITTTGGGAANGNVGLSPAPGSAILVTCAQVTGTIYAVDPSGPPCAVVAPTLLSQAINDMTTSYNDAAGRTPVPTGPNLNPGAAFSTGYDIGGLTLAPGLYKFGSGETAFINSDVTLNGGPTDVWIFQCGADLEEANGVHIILAGGANAHNIFWQVSTKAVLGTTAVFNGTILAGTSITMNTGSTMNGRALAQAAVTFNGTGAALPVIAPLMIVQQPLGTDLTNGVSTNNFGSVTIGTNTSLTYTITNAGSDNLTGLTVIVGGADASMFTVTTNPVAPVIPGGSTTFTVRFTPASAGPQIATLQIASNDPTNNPFVLTLMGTGVIPAVPHIIVQQPLGANLTNGVSTNNFGSVTIGTNSSLTYTITNTGTANLTGLAITVTGADASMFTVTTNPVAPVIPGGNTTFTVRFTPTSAGPQTATLQIASNDPTNNPFVLTLMGTGIVATASHIIVQQPLGANLTNGVGTNNFGSVTIGTNSSLTYTITNTGTANLTGLAVTVTGADASMFTVTTNPVAPVIPGGSTTFTVRFTPASAGSQIATLQIASNDPTNNPFVLGLTGTGVAVATASHIIVQQPLGANLTNGVSTNNFGSVTIGTNSSLTYTITNTGTANLTGLAVTVTGADASMFTVTTNPVAPVIPGGGTTFTVRFTPASAGSQIAILQIASNDPTNNPFNLTLVGTGATAPTAPRIGIQQPLGTNLTNGVSTNNFGSIMVGTNTSLSYTITNTGTANLTGVAFIVGGADASMFTVTTNPAGSVVPGGSTTFTVRFTPASAGSQIATLQITSNDPTNNPFNLVLVGTGVTASHIVIQQPLGTNLTNGVSTNNFGSVTIGTNSSLTYTITNTGTANLTGLAITVTGADASMFTVTTNPVAPVVPGGSTTFTVRFTPASAGSQTATLQIASNDTNNNPFAVALIGTGMAPTHPGIVIQQPLGTNLTNGVSTNNFGSVIVGTNTSLTFTITNTGTANLTGLAITVGGADASMFAVTTNPVASVIPGGSTIFTVRFTPASVGLHAVTLQIANNDTNNNPFTLALVGTGIIIPTNAAVTYTSPVLMDPQIGLFTNSVVVTNGTPNTIAAIRLLIENLPGDVQVYNQSGSTTNGIPYVQYNFPLLAGATVNFTIEYYRANREAFLAPTYVVQDLTNAVVLTVTNGVGIGIDKIVPLNGGMLVEFYATPGRTYAIQYSADTIHWQTADPLIVAPANYVQWLDHGAPQTEPLAGSRFYRAFELP